MGILFLTSYLKIKPFHFDYIFVVLNWCQQMAIVYSTGFWLSFFFVNATLVNDDLWSETHGRFGIQNFQK